MLQFLKLKRKITHIIASTKVPIDAYTVILFLLPRTKPVSQATVDALVTSSSLSVTKLLDRSHNITTI